MEIKLVLIRKWVFPEITRRKWLRYPEQTIRLTNPLDCGENCNNWVVIGQFVCGILETNLA